jgi:hypothetical protein
MREKEQWRKKEQRKGRNVNVKKKGMGKKEGETMRQTRKGKK